MPERTIFPNLSKFIPFAAAPSVLSPLVRNQTDNDNDNDDDNGKPTTTTTTTTTTTATANDNSYINDNSKKARARAASRCRVALQQPPARRSRTKSPTCFIVQLLQGKPANSTQQPA